MDTILSSMSRGIAQARDEGIMCSESLGSGPVKIPNPEQLAGTTRSFVVTAYFSVVLSRLAPKDNHLLQRGTENSLPPGTTNEGERVIWGYHTSAK